MTRRDATSFLKRKRRGWKLVVYLILRQQRHSLLRIISSIQNISRFLIGLNPVGNSSTSASVDQIWKKFETSSKMSSTAQATASKRTVIAVVGSVASVRKWQKLSHVWRRRNSRTAENHSKNSKNQIGTKVDNCLVELHNSSYHTKPHPIIVNYERIVIHIRVCFKHEL